MRISLTLDDELGHDLDAAAAGGNRSARVGLRLRTHVTFSPTVAESRGNGRLARLLHSHRGSAEPTRSDVGDNGVVTVREPQHHPIIIVLNATPNWHLPYRCSAGQAKRLTPSLGTIRLITDKVNGVTDSVPQQTPSMVELNLVQNECDLRPVRRLQHLSPSVEDAYAERETLDQRQSARSE